MMFEWLKSRKPARLHRSCPSVKGVLAVLALVAISEPLRLRAQSAGWEPCAKRQIPIASKIRCADALHAGCTSATGPSEPQAKQTLLVAVVDENNVAVPTVQVTLTEAGGRAVSRGDTDHAGRRLFRDLHYGNYE